MSPRNGLTVCGSLMVLALGCKDAPPAPGPASASATSSAAPITLPELPTDPRERALAQAIVGKLSKQHLHQQPLDDSFSQRAFDGYLERLDGGKLYLLEAHAAALRSYSQRIDDELASGQLELPRKGGALLAQRQQVVAAVIAELLAKPFDFSKREELETDTRKLSYCTTEADLRERWRKVLKLLALERIAQMEGTANPTDGDFAAHERKSRAELAEGYESRFRRLRDADTLDALVLYFNAIGATYDPHTAYLPPAKRESFDIEMSGSLEGIGALLVEEGRYIGVREVVAGGAAWRQGDLEVGDRIVAVAERGKAATDLADMPLKKAVRLIRGPKGTVATLTVRKPTGRVEAIAITRDAIEVAAAHARGAVLERTEQRVGYVHLPQFYAATRETKPSDKPQRDAAKDVGELLEIYAKRRLPGVILDLRGNGGGLLDPAVRIAGLLIETGPVVQIRSASGKHEVIEDRDPALAYQGDVVLLVDGASASSSEILAAVLQDYRRAVVVGPKQTYGKGTLQILAELQPPGPPAAGGPLGVLKLTVEQYCRVSGPSTQLRGVVPDVRLPDPASHLELGERFIGRALPGSRCEPAKFRPWSKGRWNAKQLAAESEQRAAASATFRDARASSDRLRSLRKQTQVPLELAAWRAWQRQTSDGAAATKDEAKPRFTVKSVSYGGGPAKPVRPEPSELGRDAWVEEAMNVLRDMAAATRD